jgi:inner membrane protein
MVTPYTHGAFGLGLGKLLTSRRLPVLFWALTILLPIAPDFDVFFNRPYGSIWGHRGFTHSLCFALIVGLLVAGLTFKYFQVRFWVLAGFFFVITASHGVLDAFTNGGFGISFFWPFDDRRFGPWGPIQVQDIGFEFPDPRTSRSIRTELLWVWLPTGALVLGVMAYRRLRKNR